MLNSNATRHFVCSIMNGPCGIQVDDCEESLSNLAIITGRNYADGNSQGCRALHSVFAAMNSKHCAHISIEPKNDTDGNIKCQQSQGILSEDMFDEDDFALFIKFQEEVGIDPGTGFKETGVKSASNICTRQQDFLRFSPNESQKLEELYSK